MLDVPKSHEKSYADGKILQRVSDGVGVITIRPSATRCRWTCGKGSVTL